MMLQRGADCDLACESLFTSLLRLLSSGDSGLNFKNFGEDNRRSLREDLSRGVALSFCSVADVEAPFLSLRSFLNEKMGDKGGIPLDLSSMLDVLTSDSLPSSLDASLFSLTFISETYLGALFETGFGVIPRVLPSTSSLSCLLLLSCLRVIRSKASSAISNAILLNKIEHLE